MGHHLVPLQKKNNFAILIIVDLHAGWIPEFWPRLHPKLVHHPTFRLYNMYIFSANLRIYGLYEIKLYGLNGIILDFPVPILDTLQKKKYVFLLVNVDNSIDTKSLKD